MTSRNAQRFLLLLAAFLVASCGTLTKLAYSNATLAYKSLAPMASWMVYEYVDLDGYQKDWVRDRLNRVMAWHRANELPQYRAFLEHVLAESNEPFTVDEISKAYADLRDHYHRMVEHLLPDAADFFRTLDTEQAAQMEKKFEDDNRKFVKESTSGSPDERLKRRADKFNQHLDAWLGRVTPEQKTLVLQRLELIPDFVEDRLADRRYRQHEVMALIRAKPSKQQMIDGLHKLLVDTESWRRPEFQKRMRERDQRMFELLAALSKTLTPEQRAHLQGRIRHYLADIGSISGK